MGSSAKGKEIMSLYRKVTCICFHAYEDHPMGCNFCLCNGYNPAGHNPDLENVLCPMCRLVHLEKTDDTYVCISCGHVMTEKQVLELVG